MASIPGKQINPNELKKGDKFRVLLREEVFDSISSTGKHLICDKSGAVYLSPGDIVILTEKAFIPPAGYPIQEGDVWRNETRDYHVIGDKAYWTGPTGKAVISKDLMDSAVRQGDFRLVYRKDGMVY